MKNLLLYHFVNTIFLGVGCSIAAVIIYNLWQSVVLCFMFRKISGTYLERNEKGKFRYDSEFNVKFPFFRNIFFLGYSLYIEQNSDKRGNWKSNIGITPNNPYFGTGFFKYLTVYKRAWGIHNVTINFENNILCMEAEVKNKIDKLPSKFWLVKNEKVS